MTEPVTETAPESTIMRGAMSDGRTITWIPESPWLLGDPSLTAEIKTRLFVHKLQDGQIAVTPTGPWVKPEVSDRYAVFAAANELTRFAIKWVNPPDVSFGAEPGTIF